ncbi:MAG: outer membrane beta-barrel protein [Ekhidna sp.]|nr:outer membrane beta-barrel protein [Ekhidna sp.]
MKKLLLIICLIATFAISANAQFHIELGMNGNSPQGDFGDVYQLGIGSYVEPKYAISENLDLGLLIGRNVFGGVDDDIKAASSLNILPTGTYRFSTNNVTPYVGAGLGLYFFDFGSVLGEESTSTEFGFAPRAGVYIGRLNLGVAYNVVKDLNFLQYNLGIRILSRD